MEENFYFLYTTYDKSHMLYIKNIDPQHRKVFVTWFPNQKKAEEIPMDELNRMLDANAYSTLRESQKVGLKYLVEAMTLDKREIS